MRGKRIEPIPTDTNILGVRVDPTSYQAVAALSLEWAEKRQSRYVCVASVHVIMEAHDSPDYKMVVNGADLTTPDGMPLVGFYGGSQETLQQLLDILKRRNPALKVKYAYSPPFREPSMGEDDAITRDINASGTSILFVGLGCPKQERWMAGHKGKIQVVMLGVGAAFDFLAGAKRQAPRWMQGIGLEWLYRLSQEPGRLWRRYLYHNPRFIVLVLLQLLTRGR
jgi:N-acetylglucosaminyldiphosphoundecaprenol N-acetyl-beta-D-mannosaminyltransferase